MDVSYVMHVVLTSIPIARIVTNLLNIDFTWSVDLTKSLCVHCFHFTKLRKE